MLLCGSRQWHESDGPRRRERQQGWCFCRAPGALDKETGATVVVPTTLRRDLLSHFRSASITPGLALVSHSRSRSAGNRYVKAWSRRQYTNKCCRAYWIDPRSSKERSKVCWSWITGQRTPPRRRCSPMTMNVGWRIAVLYLLWQVSPGKRVRRPEQVECTVHSVDDSMGRSNVALDAYDVGYRLWRECTIQKSFRGEEPYCLINHLVQTYILS